jgi:predicted transcriptional regulator
MKAVKQKSDKMVRMTIRLDSDVYAWLKAEALRCHCSMASIVREALEQAYGERISPSL